MTVQQFIEKAIEGGYKGRGIATNGSWYGDSVFLIPDVWKAVGKVEGWKCDCMGLDDGSCMFGGEAWMWNMHRMIDALAEGKTVGQYLETL